MVTRYMIGLACLAYLDRFLDGDQLSSVTSENFSDLEGLGEETLDLAGAGDGKLVFLRQLVHTQNGNDILKGLVVLEDLLDTTSNVVVLITNDVRVQDTGGGVERIDGGVDTQLGNGTRQHSGGVQVSEGGSRGRIGQIVGGYVDSLNSDYRTVNTRTRVF